VPTIASWRSLPRRLEHEANAIGGEEVEGAREGDVRSGRSAESKLLVGETNSIQKPRKTFVRMKAVVPRGRALQGKCVFPYSLSFKNIIAKVKEPKRNSCGGFYESHVSLLKSSNPLELHSFLFYLLSREA
jgi:hypothetical protein